MADWIGRFRAAWRIGFAKEYVRLAHGALVAFVQSRGSDSAYLRDLMITDQRMNAMMHDMDFRRCISHAGTTPATRTMGSR